jgi:hypothetical protein
VSHRRTRVGLFWCLCSALQRIAGVATARLQGIRQRIDDIHAPRSQSRAQEKAGSENALRHRTRRCLANVFTSHWAMHDQLYPSQTPTPCSRSTFQHQPTCIFASATCSPSVLFASSCVHVCEHISFNRPKQLQLRL